MSDHQLSQRNVYRPPSLARLYRLEIAAEIVKTLRTPGFVIPSLLFPPMFYLFFGVIFSQSANDPGYLLATYGTFGVMGPALFAFGVGVAVERSQGWFELKRVAPMPVSAYLLSRIVLSLVFSLAIVVILFTLGALAAQLRFERGDWALLALTLVLGSLPFCAMGLALGLSLKASSAPAVVNLLYLPMAFLSGLWIPVNFFPVALQSVANVLPAYHLSQLALKVIGADRGQSIGLHLGVLVGYSVVFAWFAARSFRREDSPR